MPKVEKREYEYADDLYIYPQSAVERSAAIALGGTIHMIQVNGIIYWRPGATPEAYAAHIAADAREELKVVMEAAQRALEEMSEELAKRRATIAKQSEEMRLAYGWANVSMVDGEDVVDLQDEISDGSDLEKAAKEYMLGDRLMKNNHTGGTTGKAVFMFPLTKEVKKALQIESPYEGLIIGSYVEDDDTWALIKSGELSEFSIGGTAEVEENA